MEGSRRRAVQTTKKLHGRKHYVKMGAMSSGKGKTFLDPEKAREANLKSQESRKLNRLKKAQENADNANSQDNQA